MIHIVNFPFCNYSAVARLLSRSGFAYQDLDASININADDSIILPGVGSFEQGMGFLNHNGLTSLIQSHAESGGKIIGICLGLQLLFQSSEESPGCQGLSIYEGEVIKIPRTSALNVPHIGWNAVHSTAHTPQYLTNFFDFSGLSIADFYFVHSYYSVPKDKSLSIGFIPDTDPLIDVAFCLNNVYAFQFHPEKSGPSGYELICSILRS